VKIYRIARTAFLPRTVQELANYLDILHYNSFVCQERQIRSDIESTRPSEHPQEEVTHEPLFTLTIPRTFV
jgi:hypothetical protein